MSIPKLTHSKFLTIRGVFHKAVMQSPRSVTLYIEEADKKAGSVKEFMGSSPRNRKSEKTHKVLYESIISPNVRDQVGYVKSQSGVIYLSPIDLKESYGTYKIDERGTRIIMNGYTYLVDHVEYLEELFESCVAVELWLREAKKG